MPPDERTAKLRDAVAEANGADADSTSTSFGADTLYSHENLHVLVYDWLNATFPNGGRNRFINGAQGGVGSGYFAWCFSELAEEHAVVWWESLVGGGKVDCGRSSDTYCRGARLRRH